MVKLKNLLSSTQKQWVKLRIAPLILKKQYNHDYKKFRDNSYYLKQNKDLVNLNGLLTFHSHALEKGFVHDNFRAGYGHKAIIALLDALDIYEKNGYSKNNLRYRIAIDTLKEYKKVHEDIQFSNKNTQIVNDWLKKHNENLIDNIKDGGYFELTSSEIEVSSKKDFNDFSNMRHSIRNFNGKSIKDSVLSKVIDLAANAPSVCNRQSSKVYNIKNKDLIADLLEIQHGIVGMAEGVSNLLIVTSDSRYFGGINERNQPYIDGGIFSMNLLYALQYNMVAACPLNANLTLKGEQLVKEDVGMDAAECIVMFIAIGGFKENNKIPLSKREDSSSLLINVGESSGK
ncbi:nitroreductase family protein [Latilactobacillus curvatus]|uniref:nitroreductase family protein n=1 Tax=Latilactobacillus curvatus TaxID=28038 RepID=UPI002D79AF97|nr:nitroreductase family protein [Latilactobacillus curvatus]WRS46838.1 nitroreductase family protein [Latilactobacillus curvatus]